MKSKLPVIINKESLPKIVRHPYSFTKQFQQLEFDINELRVVVRILQVVKSIQQLDKPIQVDLNNNVELLFKVRDLMIDRSKNYHRVYDALKTLREKTMTNNDTFIQVGEEKIEAVQMFGFIESPSFSKNNSIVSIKLKGYWFKYLLDLSKGYTQYLAESVFLFSNPYSPKFYFIISHWFDKKGMSFSYDLFINEFEIPLNYSTSKIEERILIPVRKELDKHADKSFNWKFIYLDGTELHAEQKKRKGARPKSISMVFYANKDKAPKKLNAFEHAEAQIALDKFKRNYKLDEEECKILYGLFRTYSLETYISVEKELKSRWKGLSGMDFLNKISLEVRKYNG